MYIKKYRINKKCFIFRESTEHQALSKLFPQTGWSLMEPSSTHGYIYPKICIKMLYRHTSLLLELLLFPFFPS